MVTIKPKIFKRNGKQRYGKGFSREELKKAGLSIRESLKLSIPVDPRRKTAHKENVNSIKKLLKSIKEKSRVKKTRKSKS